MKIKSYFDRIKYRFKGIKISQNVDLSDTNLEEFCNIAHHAQISNSSIGKRTSIGRYTKIQYADIGKYCSISWDVTIGAIGHPMRAISMHAFSYRKQFGICNENLYLKHDRVTIGNDVWIGCNVVILPGVKIGSGAVIGAGSVVTKDIAPYEIVAGNPARHKRFRFEQDIREKLLISQWWDLDDESLKANLELFHPQNDLTVDKVLLDRLIDIRNNK